MYIVYIYRYFYCFLIESIAIYTTAFAALYLMLMMLFNPAENFVDLLDLAARESSPKANVTEDPSAINLIVFARVALVRTFAN